MELLDGWNSIVWKLLRMRALPSPSILRLPPRSAGPRRTAERTGGVRRGVRGWGGRRETHLAAYLSSVHKATTTKHGQLTTVVGYPVLLEIVRSNPFAPAATTNSGAPNVLRPCSLLLLPQVNDPSCYELYGLVSVFVLRRE